MRGAGQGPISLFDPSISCGSCAEPHRPGCHVAHVIELRAADVRELYRSGFGAFSRPDFATIPSLEATMEGVSAAHW
jgi:hypothetical protein